jgi:RIO kinase 1
LEIARVAHKKRSPAVEPPATFVPIQRAVRPAWDDDEVDPEASTYIDARHGPEPVPSWVITSDEARQLELGALKSGKEADVFLVERRWGDRVNLLAAKRYRDAEDRLFRDDARFRQARRTGNRRTDLAMAKGTRRGMAFRAEQWVTTEFETLTALWSRGVAVPYPVQLLGHELLLEYLGDEEQAAPRLAQTRPDPAGLRALFDQFVELVLGLAEAGVVHGDLSPFNLLVWRDRLYAIDFPQAADPYRNQEGLTLLHHDISTVCAWFRRRGLDCDADTLYADALSRTLR